MSRTVFVNPSFINPRRRKKGKKSGKRRSRGRRRAGKRTRYSMRGRVSLMRRNAGIAPFVQNPLILSNPRPRRRRRSNPGLGIPSVKSGLSFGVSTGVGAAGALTLNTAGLSRIGNVWGRRGAQLGSAVVGGYMISKKSSNAGAAFAGAMMYPLLQDIAADLLGIGFAAGSASKEADLDALAADLEDVLDDMDGGIGDDEEEYAW